MRHKIHQVYLCFLAHFVTDVTVGTTVPSNRRQHVTTQWPELCSDDRDTFYKY